MRVRPLAALAVAASIAVVAAVLTWWLLADHITMPTLTGRAAGASDHVTFTDETLALGVLTAHRQGDDHLTGLDETLGSGACALDYDNDGAIDLFIVNGSGDTRYYGRRHWWQQTAGHSLLKNRGDGHFEDVTRAAMTIRPTRGFGCVAADFDNDGNQDVLVTGIDENLLLRNLGNGRFMDVTEQSGLKGHGWQTAAAVADVDGDGLLDIYVGRLIAFEKGGRIYEPGSQYKQDVPGSFNSALYPAQANSLYRNLGSFHFDDVAAQAGVANPDGRTLGAAWLDLDADGRPDLIVANAAGTGSTAVFRNEAKWRFTALGSETRLQAASGARAATVADLDNDGVPEILMTATNGAQSAIFVRQNSSTSAHPVFNDRARQWSFARDDYSGYSPWSAVAADFDNDGWLDVFVGNGLAIPDPDAPRLTVGQPKQLWLNSRHGALRPQVLAAMDPLLDRQSARGVVAADFDNDGDVDLYVTHNNDLGQLLINQSAAGSHWIGLKLVNTDGNRDAVGARVELRGSDGEQYRWIVNSMGFLSGSDPRVHFGLGSSARIKNVVVTWPDGDHSTFRDLPVDHYITLKRGEQPRVEQPSPHAASNYASLTRTLTRAREPALRADYIRLLVEARGLDAAIDEIRESLGDSDAAVRSSSVGILAAHPSAASLAALLDSLSDSDPGIVVAAVKAVCPYEEENAARWLLRLFAHPAPAVRTAVAGCFADYFHEEEAVVHRKYLAIPYLAEALGDADEHVQIAASRALGNAERFRGVPPLLELAGRTSSATVRAEAIRAVGLIRDRQASAGLVAMLRDRKLQREPASVAQLLVALRRLDYSALPATIAAFGAGRGEFAALSVRARLAVLHELLSADDGVVFARADVAALARRCYEKLAGSSGADEATVLALVEVLRDSNSPASIPLLTVLADTGRSAVIKASALRALSAIDPAQAAKYVERGLDASDPEVGERLLAGLAGTHVDISDRAFTAALTRAGTRANVIKVVRRVRSTAAADALLRIVGDRSAAAKERATALEALTRSAFKLALPADLYATNDESLVRAIVQYEFSRLPALYVSRVAPPVVDRMLAMRSGVARIATIDALAARREFWAKAKILAALKGSDDVKLRAHTLELIANNALEGSQILEAIGADKADPLRVEALRHLDGRPGSSAEQLLVNVLRDGSEDLHARVVAAHRLVGRLGPEVLRILERMTTDPPRRG
jgi:HEAT repeat protein